MANCKYGKDNPAYRHGMYGTPEYITWRAMIKRCANPNDPAFKNYGGRGIAVCDSWKNSFENFYADMGDRPEGLTIDRIDNDGNYEKSNCKWATRTEQVYNQRIRKDNKVGVIGVSFYEDTHKYVAGIRSNGKKYYLGCFDTIQEAARARKQGELKYRGEESA